MKTLAAVVLLALALSGVGAEPSPETHFYTVEFTHQKSAPWIVNLIFFQDVTPEKALEYLRIQLATAVRFMPSNEDVMAFAWRRPGNTSADEKQIHLPDGSSCMVCRKGKFLTGREAGLIAP